MEAQGTSRGRVPPGQFPTEGWPVLHVGDVPAFDPRNWDFRVGGLVEKPLRIDWEEFASLPRHRILADFHCVTAWTRPDNSWEGVALRTLAERVEVKREARFVRFTDGGTYDTTLPLLVALAEDALLATHHDGEPLPAEHGGPLRLVVPKRYGWKSVKWVRTADFLAEDRLGFWEVRGYSNSADPWREERYA